MIILKDGTYYNPSHADIQAWRDAYPQIDIDAELRKIAAWNWSNPARRKTARGIKRHVNQWLSQARPAKLNGGSTRERTLEQDLTDRSWV